MNSFDEDNDQFYGRRSKYSSEYYDLEDQRPYSYKNNSLRHFDKDEDSSYFMNNESLVNKAHYTTFGDWSTPIPYTNS